MSGEPSSVIHLEAKFLSSCETESRQVMYLQDIMVGSVQIDILIPKGRNQKE